MTNPSRVVLHNEENLNLAVKRRPTFVTVEVSGIYKTSVCILETGV